MTTPRPRFILINGAPRAGKDTIGRYVYDEYSSTFERFSRPHKEAFAAMTNSSIDEFFNVAYYEDHKSECIPWLNTTYRQWQIDFSESFMKPRYGNDVFGRMMVHRTTSTAHLYIVPDCGFQIEIDCLRDYDCMLIRVDRRGCNFIDDSRNYVQPAPQWAFHHINNDGSLEDLYIAVDKVVQPWIVK